MFDFCQGRDCFRIACNKCSGGDTTGGIWCPKCTGYFCIDCLACRYFNDGTSNVAPSFLEEKERLYQDNEELKVTHIVRR